MGTVRFELRSNKADEYGRAPILLNYQVRGKRKYLNTGKKVLHHCWEIGNQRAVYLDKKAAKRLAPGLNYEAFLTAKEASDLNTYLAEKRAQIRRIEDRFELDGVVYDSAMVVERLREELGPKTKESVSSKVVFEFMAKYIEDHKNTREPGSLTVYKSVKNHLEDFCRATKRTVTFDSIDYSFFQAFQNFLIDKKGLNNTTVAKQLSTIKTFLNYARVQGYSVPDKYKDFKIKRESLEVIALTNDEFIQLFNMDLSQNKRLEKVRDLFCFACATGLRFSDLAQLKWEHIKDGEIRLVVKKTKQILSIPLNGYSSAILKKYQGSLRPLPVISNQKANQYLKGWDQKDEDGNTIHHPGLCELAGINEPIEIVRYRGSKRETKTYLKHQLIGVHTGRKTFATLSLEKGMSAEEVMSITGHKDYKSFKRYVNITEHRKKLVMEKAWGKQVSSVKLKAI